MDDDEQLFEMEYGDDLEVLAQLDGDNEHLPVLGDTPAASVHEPLSSARSKRSLTFTTPSSSMRVPSGKENRAVEDSLAVDDVQQPLDNSFILPLEDSFTEKSESEVKKRVRKDSHSGGDSGAHVSKRLKSSNIANDVDFNAGNASDFASFTAVRPPVRSRVLRRVPMGDFFAVTGSEGQRVYVTVKSDNFMKNQVALLAAGQKNLQLLGTPLAALRAQLEEDKRAKELRSTDNISRRLVDQRDFETLDVEESDPAESHHSLWVDRYAPHKYTDLLSDECTNRSLLRWLKLWDFTVFGIESKTVVKHRMNDIKKKDAGSSGASASASGGGTRSGGTSSGGASGGFVPNKKPGGDGNKAAAGGEDILDQFKRPLHKVALVSGPPGLGKTTLAHIVACHAGYNVVEMNASDDRTADVFKQKIEGATQMKAVLGADPRPNCLIIDEIDGAPQPAINVLLSIIKNSDANASATAATKKKRAGNAGLLQRPIICICNDLYVPSLRQLRPLAFLITFHTTAPVALAGRLLEISKVEQLRTDLTTLLALCEKADNDIRSCLNTLQFVKAQKSELTLQSVQSLSLGQKDSHKTLFAVWQHIFTMPKPKRKRYINPYDRVNTVEQVEELKKINEENTLTLSSRFQSTLHMAQAAGEYSRVQQGLFENYLEVKIKDPRLSLLQSAVDWLCFVDIIDDLIGTTQNYSLFKYLPYLSVAFHLLFASNHPHKIIYPHGHFEFQTKLTRSENLVATLLADAAPSIRSSLNRNVIVMELLPLLVDIIQPTLRPVNTQLYSAREKAEMLQLINIMIAYNLSYQQTRGVDGQYTYCLEPNVDELVRFPNIKPSRQLTYGAKQLIAREIELEKLRKSEAAFALKCAKADAAQPQQDSKPSVSTGKAAAAAASTDNRGPQQSMIPNHKRQMLEPKNVSIIQNKPTLDFFGRKIVKPVTENTAKEDTPKTELTGGDVWFRFKEGYTNAVRKMVRIQDLL